MTLTDYRLIDELHNAVEPYKITRAAERIRHVSNVDTTHTGLEESFNSTINEIKDFCADHFNLGGRVGLRAVFVSISDKEIDNVQILIDNNGEDYLEVSVPTAIDLIRTGSEKEGGIFRVVSINGIQELKDRKKIWMIQSYFNEGVVYVKNHHELRESGLRPAVIVYNLDKLEYQKEYKYKISPNANPESIILGLVITDMQE